MTERKRQKLLETAQSILPCAVLFPFFLLFVAAATVCSLLDHIICRWEQKPFFHCSGRADA